MKKFFPFLIIAYLLYSLSGCGNNTVTGPSGSNVTFKMGQQTGPNGGVQFLFQPSVNVTVSKLIVILQVQPPQTDTIVSTIPNYIYSKDSVYTAKEYQGVTSGQIYKFNFSGSIATGGSAYNVTATDTIP